MHTIIIYGPGCARCEELELRTRQAVNALSGQYDVRHERDAAAMAAAGKGKKIRLRVVAGEAWDIVRGVLPYVLAGIAIGAAVHGYVPQDYFADLLGGGWWSVPAAVLCAVPLYANAASIVPVMEVLVSKGVPLGTALAFMMAVVGLSLPEAMLLKKVMQWRLLAIFFGTVTLLIILSGYIFLLLF